MNKKIIILAVSVIVIVILFIVLSPKNSDDNSNTANTNSSLSTNTINSSAKQNSNTAMMEDEVVNTNLINEDTLMEEKTSGKYTNYSSSAYNAESNMKRVLFFHATWCPTCKSANQAFTDRASEIPENVVIFKTDYDSETELKNKYGITYQHTFVLVDQDGNELEKWNGGDIDQLIKKVQ